MRTTTLAKIIILSLIAISNLATKVSGQSPLTRPAHVGLIYPISTNGKDAPAYTNQFSLHVFAGVSKAETGAAVAGISNIVKENVSGAVVAGFSNHIGNITRGVSVAGFMNTVHNKAQGAMVAGFINSAKELKGYQVAGFGNFAAKGDTSSGQLAGFLNRGDTAQLSIAGFGNMHRAAKVQLAGFINANGNAHTQIAGFMNIAKKVKGVQVAGFLNIADSSDYSIGIINIVKNGEKQFSLSIDETTTTILSFKSGGRVMYGIIGVGYNFKDADTRYAIQAGIGAHLFAGPRFRINVEATSTALTDFSKWQYHKQTLAILPAWRLGSRVEVFAGPTFNHVYSKDGVGEDLSGYYLWSKHYRNNKFWGDYIGGTAGVQVKL
ncbi:hypothetical protein [Chitinophaga sp. HK235]|uniref:hypothetical protein n=1 Tax=Chitinophaga sp. HK235 TaxID=2952571 RepID=UPI001BAA1CDF|nr:hypothetical protein [Chitinophaga sp. HK235]